MEACDVRAPYTLLGFLLGGGGGGVVRRPSAVCFSVRDYFARATNFLLWVALISITFLLVRKLARVFRLWAKGSSIPGPPCPSFFAGHSRLVGRCGSARDLTGYLADLHEKHGPIVRLWFGPTRLVVSVKDVAVIKEMLMMAKDRFPLMGRGLRLAFGGSNIFFSSFEKVQEGRQCLAAYLNARLDEGVTASPLRVVDSVIGRLESIMSKGIVDCRTISHHISFYILGTSLFEEAFLRWSNLTMYEELLLMISKDACFWASYKIPPVWRREYWRFQLLCRELKRLTGDMIRQCWHRYNMSTENFQDTCKETKSFSKRAEKDSTTFSGELLSGDSSIKEKMGCIISDQEPFFGDILGLMFHGCLTVASLVCSTLTRLALHPELQMKIFSEIKEVQQLTGKENSYDVEKMHLLLATIYESARLLPPGPLLQRCSLSYDLSLQSSITVPAGAIIVVPLQLVQMDNSVWGRDAFQFKPHRFVSSSVNQEGIFDLNGFMESNEHAAYLPFGYGPRACVGQKIAISGISTFFASLLSNYEIRLEPGSETELERSVHSPKVSFVRRPN